MSKGGQTIYQTSRNAAKLSREEAADLLHISVRQLTRYEATSPEEATTPPDDVVALMMEVYEDLYLGYLHAMKSPVMRKLLPEGIVPLPMLNTITKLGHKATHFTEQVFRLQEAALDNDINPNEQPLWEHGLADADELAGAALSMKFIIPNKEQ